VVRRESKVAADWFADAFDELYPVVYAHRSVEAARDEAAFAAAYTGLTAGDRVLDLCCGAGRHMAHLGATAARVVGLDYSVPLLLMAREHLGARRALTRGDMRALPFTAGAFDVVLSFFTSFGYFLDEAEDCRAAREMARVLAPKGRFFLDYLNATQVCASLVPHSERREDPYMVVEDRWLDEAAARVNKKTAVLQDHETVAIREESVRLYTRPGLTAILADAGLRVEECLGDFSGGCLRDDSPRLILVGGKVSEDA